MHSLVHHHRPDGSPYPAPDSPIVQALQTGLGSRVDRDVFWRRDGTSFPAEYSCNPIRAPGGQLQGAVVTFTDSTERNRLRQLVVQSEKMASLGLLSAGIAHEINNPLAYVANNLVVLERDYQHLVAVLDAYEGLRDLLAQVDAGAAARVQALAEEFDLPYVRANLGRLLAKTREGVQRVARIVQSLRGLARIDRPELAEVGVQQLVEMNLEMLRGRLKRCGTEVVLDLERAPRLRCVSTQMSQLLLNLLTNAMQAIEATGRTAGGRIRVSSRSEGERIILEVVDNGCGMPPEHIPKIFDPFFTTKAVGEGTGLGLAIAHGIVSGHGGRIEVESQAGQGTCFRIVLPRDPERGSV
jgi:signal transduction histidine kinase